MEQLDKIGRLLKDKAYQDAFRSWCEDYNNPPRDINDLSSLKDFAIYSKEKYEFIDTLSFMKFVNTHAKQVSKESTSPTIVISIFLVILLVVGLIFIIPKCNSISSTEANSDDIDYPVDVNESKIDYDVATQVCVEKYLENNLKDPSSLEEVAWSKAEKDSEGNYNIILKYRAKNGFGALTIETKRFTVSPQTGKVLEIQDAYLDN